MEAGCKLPRRFTREDISAAGRVIAERRAEDGFSGGVRERAGVSALGCNKFLDQSRLSTQNRKAPRHEAGMGDREMEGMMAVEG